MKLYVSNYTLNFLIDYGNNYILFLFNYIYFSIVFYRKIYM